MGRGEIEHSVHERARGDPLAHLDLVAQMTMIIPRVPFIKSPVFFVSEIVTSKPKVSGPPVLVFCLNSIPLGRIFGPVLTIYSRQLLARISISGTHYTGRIVIKVLLASVVGGFAGWWDRLVGKGVG